MDTIKSPQDTFAGEINLDNGGYYLLSTAKWPDWFLYQQNTDKDDGNARGWKNDPGAQGHFKFHKTEDGNYLMSTEFWPLRFMYMQ